MCLPAELFKKDHDDSNYRYNSKKNGAPPKLPRARGMHRKPGPTPPRMVSAYGAIGSLPTVPGICGKGPRVARLVFYGQ